MDFRFNSGNGAIHCSKCGKILLTGDQIPQEVWDAVKCGVVNNLPDMYCEGGCDTTTEYDFMNDDIAPSLDDLLP